jgi:peptide/nickel transport system ATP-binding protein
LISTLPTLGTKGVFHGIPGITPSLLNPPSGCLFYRRCPQGKDICSEQVPPLVEVKPGRFVACHLGSEV